MKCQPIKTMTGPTFPIEKAIQTRILKQKPVVFKGSPFQRNLFKNNDFGDEYDPIDSCFKYYA